MTRDLWGIVEGEGVVSDIDTTVASDESVPSMGCDEVSGFDVDTDDFVDLKKSPILLFSLFTASLSFPLTLFRRPSTNFLLRLLQLRRLPPVVISTKPNTPAQNSS